MERDMVEGQKGREEEERNKVKMVKRETGRRGREKNAEISVHKYSVGIREREGDRWRREKRGGYEKIGEEKGKGKGRTGKWRGERMKVRG